jgi:hypothetical protein
MLKLVSDASHGKVYAAPDILWVGQERGIAGTN